MMSLVTVLRSMAKLEYTAVRLPFTILDECMVARYWHDQGLMQNAACRSVSSVRSMSSPGGSLPMMTSPGGARF